ncbi:Aste57867_20705 [Aphanomyces stellatus]|uniref:Aste57867_20705 protein n=1 Tax=Aphanomyces stellatus TaxID=120398 RepID=A0A485LFJ9_9STRA|nr:hypothetical protein As57867_020637 [Aphanomyces stellatus]VFT97385.1 Aste57867_20705 [Aphanomyces stellatus]
MVQDPHANPPPPSTAAADMAALDYSFQQNTDYDDDSPNYLDQDDMNLSQAFGLRLEKTFPEWRGARRPQDIAIDEEDDDSNNNQLQEGATASTTPSSQRCATLLARIRDKIFARLANGETDAAPAISNNDYLAPDESDGEGDVDDLDSPVANNKRKRDATMTPKASTDLTAFLGRSLDFDPLSLLPPPPQDLAPPSAMPPYGLPFLCLPMKANPKCVLPSVPPPAVKKYNHRSIYNCVRCGQMKKFHVCSFPENVRSVGTSMSSSTTPRDNVSRYYKCGRVLVCKK